LCGATNPLARAPGEIEYFRTAHRDFVRAVSMRRDWMSHLTNSRAMMDQLNVNADTDVSSPPEGPFGARWWRNWFDHSPDAQFVLDVTGIIECNAQALRVLGHVDKSRVLNREPASLSPEIQPDGSPSDRGATAW
jgi:PAS domain-containing protein